jgi:hypothetical protein
VIFQELEQIALVDVGERGEAEVVDDQELGFAKMFEQ